MHFPNTTALMNDLQQASHIHLEQVMQLIEKLFADIQHQTGDLVEDCRIENMDQLVPTLSAVTNDIVYIFRNHEEDISAAQNKYFGALTKAQSACNLCREQLGTIQKTIEDLEKEEARLTLQRQEAALLHQNKAALIQKVQELQAQIARFSPADGNSDADRLQQEIMTREEELQSLKAQFSEHQAYAVKLQEQIQRQQADIGVLTGTIAQKRQSCDGLNVQLVDLNAETQQLDQNIAEKQQQVRSNVESQKQKRDQLERIQAVIDEHAGVLSALEQELAKFSSLEAEKAREAALVKEQLDAVRGRLDAQEKLLAEHRSEHQHGQARLKHAQESLQQICADIAHTQASIQAAEQTLYEEQNQAEALKLSLFNVNSDVEYQKSDNEKYQQEFLLPAQTQLEALKAQLDADQQRYQELEADLKQKKAIRSSLVSANNSLENSIHYAQSKLEELEALHRKSTEELRQLQAAVGEKNSVIENLVDTRNKLRELLNGRDSDLMRRDLEEEHRLLEEEIQKADALEVRIREMQAERSIAQSRLDRDQSELDSLSAAQQALQEAHSRITAQLEQANSKENRLRSAALQNQLNLMRTLAEKLSAGTSKACGDRFALDHQICESLNSAELTIQTIRQAICDYTDYRQSALEYRD